MPISAYPANIIIFIHYLCAMEKFYGEIYQFLNDNGLYIYKVGEGYGYISVKAECHRSNRRMPLLLLEIRAFSPEEAERQQTETSAEIARLTEESGTYPLIITQDRWIRQGEMTRCRLLAHLEIFTQIYARNCEVRRIDKTTAQNFLEANHSYGDAACKYRYGLYLRRHTGHNALLFSKQQNNHNSTYCHAERSEASPVPGTLIAVATFSNARKWIKGDKTIRSYEWTRYASLPGVRLSGGMGKVLKTFIKEVQPDDIMTYADLEWSEGKVYEQLGFTLEGVKEPVTFLVDSDCRRRPDRPDISAMEEDRWLRNFGSNKYRLKLTDYQ